MLLNAFLPSFDGYWAYAGFKGKRHAIILVTVDTVAAPTLSIVGQ